VSGPARPPRRARGAGAAAGFAPTGAAARFHMGARRLRAAGIPPAARRTSCGARACARRARPRSCARAWRPPACPRWTSRRSRPRRCGAPRAWRRPAAGLPACAAGLHRLRAALRMVLASMTTNSPSAQAAARLGAASVARRRGFEEGCLSLTHGTPLRVTVSVDGSRAVLLSKPALACSGLGYV